MPTYFAGAKTATCKAKEENMLVKFHTLARAFLKEYGRNLHKPRRSRHQVSL
jgi:hypothetical protein